MLRRLAAAGIVAAGFALIVALYALGLSPAEVTQRDYIEYWAAGRQLVHHANPYDYAAIFALERQNGMQTDQPRISFSPPVALEFELPLGWMGAKTGLILWLVAELVCVLISLWLLWRMNGSPDSRLHLLGLAFAPVIACQMSGQLGAFFLLSLVLFFAWHRTHPFLAGAALMPFALKPHLVVPFAIALILWCVARRSYSVLAGALAALAVSCGLSLGLDPHAWSQYSELSKSFSLVDWFVPTVGMALRYLVDRSARWLGFVPEAAACAWAVWYAWSRRAHWDWMKQGQLVLLVSVLCAPYSWVSDQCILLPAVLMALYQTARRVPALAAFLAIDAVMLAQAFRLPSMTSWWFVWTAPAWLVWYLYVTPNVPLKPANSASEA